MNEPIVSSPLPIILMGGAEPASDAVNIALEWGKIVVCADGGADWALWNELSPAAVIGDMDSISPTARSTFADVVYEITEQDSTDFDKALRHIQTPLVLGVGFSGARIDHELGALAVLVRYPERRCILIGDDTITLLCPPQIRLDLAADTPVSLFPMGEVGCDSEGLRWDTGGLRFAPDGQIGTLNKALGGTGGPVVLRPDAPKMVLILPRVTLGVTIKALSQDAAQWPVRAK